MQILKNVESEYFNSQLHDLGHSVNRISYVKSANCGKDGYMQMVNIHTCIITKFKNTSPNLLIKSFELFLMLFCLTSRLGAFLASVITFAFPKFRFFH